MNEVPKAPSAGVATGFPWSATEGPTPARNMLRTDFSVFDRYLYSSIPSTGKICPVPTYGPVKPGPAWRGPPFKYPEVTPNRHIPDVVATKNYAVTSPANTTVPEEKPPESGLKLGQLSKKTADVGVKFTEQRSKREYLASGYTRTNPDGKTKIDTDWSGKWKELDLQVAEQTWAKTSGAAYSKDLGNSATDWFSGGYKIGAGEAKATSAFSITKGGVNITPIAAKGSVAVAQGKAAFNKDGLVGATGEAAFMKAEGEIKAAVVINPEEATLTGKLGGSLHLAEIKGGAELCLTPTRVANGFIATSNWLFDGDRAKISDKYDIGICVGGGLSGSAGVGAEASGDIGYKKGKARAEVGVKGSLFLGAGAKVNAGFTGIDKGIDIVKGWFK